MRIVRAKSRFFQNVDKYTADEAKLLLKERLEMLIAEWMRDTGLWHLTFDVSVTREDEDVPGAGSLGRFVVIANLDVQTFPELLQILREKDGVLQAQDASV